MSACRFASYRRLLLTLLLGVLASLCVGCGLGEYEELLRKNRTIAKSGDEDRKLLGDPLDLPPIKEGDTTAPMLAEAFVFLRPPKVFQCKPAPTLVAWDTFAPQVGKASGSVPRPGKDKSERLTQLYRYAGADGCGVFLSAVTSDFIELDEQERPLEVSEFKRTVWTGFVVYLQQRRLPKDATLPTEPKQKKQEEVTPARTGKVVPAPIRYDVWMWDEPDTQAKADAKFVPPESEPARYQFYFNQNGMNQVAIVYQFPRSRANDATIQKGIEASLKSLGVGPDGATKRYNASKTK